MCDPEGDAEAGDRGGAAANGGDAATARCCGQGSGEPRRAQAALQDLQTRLSPHARRVLLRRLPRIAEDRQRAAGSP